MQKSAPNTATSCSEIFPNGKAPASVLCLHCRETGAHRQAGAGCQRAERQPLGFGRWLPHRSHLKKGLKVSLFLWMCFQASTANTQACASHSHAHGNTGMCPATHMGIQVCAPLMCVHAQKRPKKNSPICNLLFFCSLFFLASLYHSAPSPLHGFSLLISLSVSSTLLLCI